MPRQEIFAVGWGLIKAGGGPYTLSEDLLRKLKSLGYAGIELPVASIMAYDNEEGRSSGAFAAALVATNTRCIAGVFSSGAPPIPGNLGISSQRGIVHIGDADMKGTRDVKGHFTIWAAQVREALALGSALVAGINSHSGKDYFSDAEADEFFALAATLEADEATGLGIKITHETHRARVLYSPWVAPRIYAAHPLIRYTADLSHWSVVSETGTDDPEVNAVVALLAPRVLHVHARVGFEEGPQVPDPRGPEWTK
jgi:sugar phosphate isomerase/epimerase